MPETAFLGFIHSIALLLALALVLDMVGKPGRGAQSRVGKQAAKLQPVFLGLIVGGVGVLVMFNPWVLRPGLLIDSRSILLGTAGLFLGALPTLIAMLITAAFRYSMGGSGVWAGILVIGFSGTIGIAWRHFRRGALEDISWRELFLFGYAVHIIMLALMFSMPQATALQVVQTVLIPTLIITPTGTALLGRLMASRMRRDRSAEVLRADHAGLQVEVGEIQERERRYRLLTENIHDVVWVVEVDSLRFLYCSPSVQRMRGFTAEEVTAKPLGAAMLPDEADALTESIRARAQGLRGKPPGAEITFIDEIQQPCKDGSTVWAEAISTFYTNPRTGKVEVRGVTREIGARKRVETALRASQEELRQVIDTIQDLVFVVDRDLRLVLTNRAFDAAFPAVGMKTLAPGDLIVDPAYPDDFLEVWRGGYVRALAGETGRLETRLQVGGEVFTQENTFSPLRDANGTVTQALIVCHDSTQQKRGEEALRKSEERFRLAVKNTPVSVFHQNQDLRYTWIYNPPPPLEPEMFIGKDDADLFAIDQAARLRAVKQTVLDTGAPQRFEQVLSIAGKDYHFDLSIDPLLDPAGAITGIACAAVDVSAYQHALEQVTQQQQLIETIFATAPDPLILKDWQGVYREVNPAFCRFMDKTRGEIIGKTDLDLFPPADAAAYLREDAEVMRTGAQFSVDQLVQGRELRWLHVTKAAVYDPDGEISGVLSSVNDITRRKEAEAEAQATQAKLRQLLVEADESRRILLRLVEEQKAAEDQIRQLNRELEQRVRLRTAELTSANQELEAFSYSVSHDLRAPLRALEGFSNALLEEYTGQLDENGQHYLARIQEAARRMGQLINDLLRLSRITRSDLNYQEVDLGSIAASIAADLQAQAPARSVRFEIAAGLTARGDVNMLHIVLENLLGNAFKFTNRREEALVEVGKMRFGEALKLTGGTGQVGEAQSEGADPAERVFYVRDNGAGFRMEFANKLFVPFQRLHGPQEFPGSGIGLSIVQRIIARHGGRIWAESDLARGTTFFFTLGDDRSSDC